MFVFLLLSTQHSQQSSWHATDSLCLRRLKAEVHFNPWTICDRFLDAEFGSNKVEKIGNESARRPEQGATARTNLAKIVYDLEGGLGTGGGEEETKRILRRFSRMYMTTLAMEIDRIESELRHALPEFKCVVAALAPSICLI